jgi:DNA-binding XRE family transcriptional regulator
MTWTILDAGVMRKARRDRGLSCETVARNLHVASKTYERYEKRDRVPVHLLPQVVELLGLDVEMPDRHSVTASFPGQNDQVAAIRVELGELRALVEQVLEELKRSERSPQ